MKKIFRAGLVPYVINPDTKEFKMFFMKPSDPAFGGDDDGIARFQLAKGKVDDGESKQQTAVREAEEELGLIQSNIEGPIHHLGTYLGRTEMFFCKVNNQTLFNEPHYETGATAWMNEQEYNTHGRKLHQYVVADVVKQIKQIEEIE